MRLEDIVDIVNPIDHAGAFRPAGRIMRMTRSIAAALACVAVAAIGHASAGGHLSGVAVLAVFAAGATITWMLSTRQVTTSQILGLLVLCQVGVHFGMTDTAMTMDAQMIAGHIAATAISAALLARGERFVWHIAERLGLRAAPILHTVTAVPSLRPLVPVLAPRSLHDVLLAHSRSLRGPPVGA